MVPPAAVFLLLLLPYHSISKETHFELRLSIGPRPPEATQAAARTIVVRATSGIALLSSGGEAVGYASLP